MRLYESKQSTIEKCKYLTREQKDILLDFFTGKGQALWGKVDWNNAKHLTWDDFQDVLTTVSKSASKKKGALVEGRDYDVLFDNDRCTGYFIYTYEASVAMASNLWAPKVWTRIPSWYQDIDSIEQDYEPHPTDKSLWGGAKWCISMRHTRKSWRDYHEDMGYNFVFILYKNEPRKYALELHGTSVSTIWDKGDEVVKSHTTIDELNGYLEGLDGKLSKFMVKSGVGRIDGTPLEELLASYDKEAIDAFGRCYGEYPTSVEDFEKHFVGWYQNNNTFMRDFITTYRGGLIKFLSNPLGYVCLTIDDAYDLFHDIYDSILGMSEDEFNELLRKGEKEVEEEMAWSLEDSNKEFNIRKSVVYNICNSGRLKDVPSGLLWNILDFGGVKLLEDVRMDSHYYFVLDKEEHVVDFEDFDF